MNNDINQQSIDAAIEYLPVAEYGPFLPTIRQVIFENLRRGRLQKFIGQSSGLTLEDYVRQVAQTIRAETETIQRLSAHDSEAWENLHKKLRLRAYMNLLKIGVDHYEAYERANDFAQDACLAVITGHYPGDVPHTAWAQCILRNHILQQMIRNPDFLDRRQVAMVSLENGGADTETLDPRTLEFIEEVENHQTLEQALQQLESAAQRDVIRLRMKGWSDEEIAAYSHRTVQAVYNLRHRALHKLKELTLELATIEAQDQSDG